MRTITYIGLAIISAVIGAGVVLAGTLPSSMLQSVLPLNIVGPTLLVFIVAGAALVAVFVGWDTVLSNGRKEMDQLLHETRTIMTILNNSPEIRDRDYILDRLDAARTAIDSGDYEAADRALIDIEKRLEEQFDMH